MAALKKQQRREAAGDPLSDLLDDTDMKRAAARARPRAHQRSSSNASVWWIAAAASLVWIASVAAFSWSRYALPGEAGSVLDAARTRIGIADWMMIGASIVGPLLLIWVIAWLVQRAMELRDQSRRLAKAAILLTEAAETTEMRAELLLPSRGSGGLLGGPGLNKEIERATDAMSALKAQMGAMEQAMARQAATLSDRADRSRALDSGGTYAAAIPDRIERTSDNLIVQDDFTPAVPVTPKNLMTQSALPDTEDDDAGLVVTADPDGADEPAAVDMALDDAAKSRAERLRADLKAAGKAAAWPKLVEEGKLAKVPQPAAETVAAEPVATQPIEKRAEPGNDRIDPFDDLGGAAPALGAATGAAALAFGVDRHDPDLGAARLDTPFAEPAAAMADLPPATDKPAKGDFDFMGGALDWSKFVRAANFPESEDDTETLDALYDVLTDPEAAALLQSAEDTLATLADLDLYMEDFVPEMSPVTAWRAHLEGKTSSGLTGIDSPIEQSRIDAKLASDSGFRKLTGRFVERYLTVLRRLFKEAGDDRLVLDLADSRTGRAYLLLGKPLGKL